MEMENIEHGRDGRHLSCYNDETYQIIGACFEVQNQMGSGFLEPVYQACLEREFARLNIQFESQKELTLMYKGELLEQKYKPDFICFNEIILEIKASAGLTDADKAQVINYLNAAGMEIGLLVNFGHYPKLEYKRIINTQRI